MLMSALIFIVCLPFILELMTFLNLASSLILSFGGAAFLRR